LGYSRMIAPGGGLIGAIHQDAAVASLYRQLTRTLNVAVQGSYSNNTLLNAAQVSALDANDGHTLSGAASLHRQLGDHFALGLNYTRLRQSYSNIRAISGTPNTNQAWASISYQFARPLGR
jgi:hypothetical protein